MRKIILLLMMSIFLIAAACSFAADVQELLEERTVVLYPEGQLLGNMVIGARGKMEFIYVDRALAHAVRSDPSLPEWLTWNVRHWGTDALKGKALFILRYEAYKPWDFRTDDLAVGGENVGPEDILTNKAYINVGDLPSGTVSVLAFSVPLDLAAPGKGTVISYKDETREWTVPKK